MSSDKNIDKSKAQQHSEGHGDKPDIGYSYRVSGSSALLARIKVELEKPNLTDSARKALLERKKRLERRQTNCI